MLKYADGRNTTIDAAETALSRQLGDREPSDENLNAALQEMGGAAEAQTLTAYYGQPGGCDLLRERLQEMDRDPDDTRIPTFGF